MARNPDSSDKAKWIKAGLLQRIGGKWVIPPPPRDFVDYSKSLTIDMAERRAEGKAFSSEFKSSLETRVRSHLGNLEPELTKGANELVGAALSKVESFGVPSEVAGGVISAAQGIVSGDFQQTTKAATGIIGVALTPFLGPLGPIAGGLAGMALGAWFGDEKPPPPPPEPKPRKFSYKVPGEVPLWQVLEEIWIGSQRWHAGGWGFRKVKGWYEDPRLANSEVEINASRVPEGHIASVRRTADPLVRASRSAAARPGGHANLGQPKITIAPDGGEVYIFTDDVLAEFIGYNAQISATFRKRLDTVLGSDRNLPKSAKLKNFIPNFSSYGYAEFITTMALTEALKSKEYKATRDIGGQDYRTVRAISKSIVKGLGNKEAYKLSKSPFAGGTAMLCFVWSELQAVLGAGPSLQVQGANANNSVAGHNARFEKFVMDALVDIQASLGRVEPAVKKAVDNSNVILKKLEELQEKINKQSSKQINDAKAEEKGSFKMASAWPIAIGAIVVGAVVARATKP